MTIKISELPLTNSIAGGDYFVIVRDPQGAPLTSKLYASRLSEGLISVSFANVAANVIPSVDSVYSLGNIDFQWNSLYVSNQVVLGGYPLTVTDGVLSINGTSQSLTVQSTAGNNGAVNVAVSTVRTINFDDSTGLHITDQGNGAVFVELGSGFKYINVANQDSIVAVGEDSLTIANGQGITLTTSNTAPKTLTISGVAGVSGSNTEIQFNENGSLGANQNFRFVANSTTASVKLGGTQDGHIEFTSNTGNRVGEIFVFDEGLNINANSDIAFSVGAAQTQLLTLASNGEIRLTTNSYITANGTHGIPGQVLTTAGSNGVYWSDATGGGGAGGNAYNIVNTNTALVLIGDKGDHWLSLYGLDIFNDSPVETTAIDNDGNIIIGGVSYVNSANSLGMPYGAGLGYISKIDKNTSEVIWSKNIICPFFADANTDYSEIIIEGVKVDSNNNIYAFASDWSYVANTLPGNPDLFSGPAMPYVMKIDTGGNLVWSNYVGGLSDANSYYDWHGAFQDITIANNRVYAVGESNAHAVAVAFDASNGSILWTYSSDSIAFGYSTVVHQDKLLIGSSTGYVIGVDSSNGSLSFVTSLGGGFYNDDVYSIESDGTDWYAMGSGGELVKISGADNITPIWYKNYFNWSYYDATDIVYSNGHIYGTSYYYNGITVYKMDASNGNIMWVNKLTDEVYNDLYQWYWYSYSSLSVKNNDVVFGGYGRYSSGDLGYNNSYGLVAKVSTDGTNTGNTLIGDTFTYKTSLSGTMYSGEVVTTSNIVESFTQPAFTDNQSTITNTYFVTQTGMTNRTEWLSTSFYTWNFSNTGVINYPDHSIGYSGRYLKDANNTSMIVGQPDTNRWVNWMGIAGSWDDTAIIDNRWGYGGPVVYGYVYDRTDNIQKEFLTRYNSTGNVVWQKIYTKPVINPSNDGTDPIAMTMNQNTGDIVTIAKDYFNYPSSDFNLTKSNYNSGALVWSKIITLNYYDLRAITLGDSDNIYISNLTSLYKFDSNGNLLWNKQIIGDNGPIDIYTIYYDSNNGTIIIGGKNQGLNTGCIATLDTSGNVIAARTVLDNVSNVASGPAVIRLYAYYQYWYGWVYTYVMTTFDGRIINVPRNLSGVNWTRQLPLQITFPDNTTQNVYYQNMELYNGYIYILGTGWNPKIIALPLTSLSNGAYTAPIINLKTSGGGSFYTDYSIPGTNFSFNYTDNLYISGAGASPNDPFTSWDKGFVARINLYNSSGNNVPFDGMMQTVYGSVTANVASNSAPGVGTPSSNNWYGANVVSSNWYLANDTIQTYSTTYFGGPFTFRFDKYGGLTFPDGTTQSTAAAGSGSLSSLSDVQTSGNNKVVVYNSSTSKWVGTDYKVSGLLDVNASSFTSNASANNFYLKWNNALQKWQANAAVSTMVTLTDVNITANSSIDGYMVVWDNASSKFIARNPFNRAYDITGFIAQTYSSNETVAAFIASRSFTFASNMGLSYARAATASTSTVTFSLKKNNTQFGTMVFNSSNLASFTTSSGLAVSVSPGDMITVVAPGSVDTNLMDVAFNLNGTLV